MGPASGALMFIQWTDGRTDVQIDEEGSERPWSSEVARSPTQDSISSRKLGSVWRGA